MLDLRFRFRLEFMLGLEKCWISSGPDPTPITINALKIRIKIIQKLYSKVLNPDEKIIYNKSQYKKFIKDVTEGTLERRELIEETIEKFLKNDIDLKRTDKLLKIIIFAAVFELLFTHNHPKKVIISE